MKFINFCFPGLSADREGNLISINNFLNGFQRCSNFLKNVSLLCWTSSVLKLQRLQRLFIIFFRKQTSSLQSSTYNDDLHQNCSSNLRALFNFVTQSLPKRYIWYINWATMHRNNSERNPGLSMESRFGSNCGPQSTGRKDSGVQNQVSWTVLAS